MPQRRIWMAALGAIALVGFLIGGIVGFMGNDTDDGTAVAFPEPSSATATTSSAKATTIEAGITAKPSTSAPVSKSASASASTPPMSSSPPLATGTYMLTLPDGRAMDVMGASDKDGAPVIVYPASAGKANQQWMLRDAGAGFVRLESSLSHKCLQVSGGKDRRAVQDDCGSGTKQMWKPVQRGTAGWILVSRDGKAALAPGPRVKGQQALTLVPVAAGAVWKPSPA